MKIGTMFLGRVDAVGGQSIQTKFFVVGLPLIPMGSWFVLRDRVNGVQGFEIALHPKSVLLGYLRLWLMVPAVVGGLFWYLDRHDYDFSPAYPVMAIVFGVLWLASMFLGGAGGKAKRQRLALGKVTGICAYPSMLPPAVSELNRAALVKALAEKGHAAEPASLLQAADKPELLHVAWAAAVYHDAADTAQALWARIEGGPGAMVAPGALAPR